MSRTASVMSTHKHTMKMPVSKLQGKELIHFAKLNKKAKDKKLAVRLSTEEWELLKEMHMKNGTTMSETMRRSFFKTHYHHFKGVSHKAIK
jgi:hypothetical protein